MKNIILTIGCVLVVLNTLFGCIITSYPTFNFLMVDVSLALSTALIYYLSARPKIDDGFGIGFSFLFIFTGFIRTLCCLFLPEDIENNIVLLVIVGILLAEIILLVVANVLSKK